MSRTKIRRTKKRTTRKTTRKDEKKGLPLKSDRKITFTTDEGTWLSLDVSPDGKTIVFELLGDLYTLPIDGGQAKLISGGMAFDSQPKFSPDGQVDRVHFRSRRQRKYLDHSSRRHRREASLEERQRRFHFAGVDARRQIHRHVPKRLSASARTNCGCFTWMAAPACRLPSPSRRRRRRARIGHNAVGVVASPDGKYLYYAVRQGPFTLQRAVSAVENCAARSQDRR